MARRPGRPRQLRFQLPLFKRQVIHIAAIVTLGLNLFAAGLPALIAQYNADQAKIPQALQASDNNFAPASDVAASSTKATKADKATTEETAQKQRELQQGRSKKNPKHIKTLDENRSETSRTFLNDDGSRTLEHSGNATSFRDGSGKWQDVDASLEQDKGKGEWHTKSNSWRATFKETSADTAVELARGQQTVRMAPVGGRKVKPTITGTAPKQLITYQDVWPNVDLRYMVNGSEIKESLWIKSPSAQTEFTFKITGAKLTPEAGKPGQFKLDGELADFSLTQSFVATSDQGVVGDEGFVSQELAGDTLNIRLNAEWLAKQSAKAYPVVIDPSFYSNTTVQNHMSYKYPDNYNCNALACGISTGNTGVAIWRAVAWFPFSSLSPTTYLLNANLYLEMVDPGVIPYPGTYDPRNIDVYRCSTGFNYNCGLNDYGVSSGTVGYNGNIDVTGIYRNAIARSDYGMHLFFAGDEGQYSYKFMTYPDAKVTFTYTNQPGAATLDSPVEGAAVISKQPILKANTVTDPDGDPVSYRFRVATSPDAEGGTVVNSGWLDTPYFTVPDGALQDGATYYWKVQTWDGQYINPLGYQGSWNSSAIRSFRVDMRNGKDATQAYDATGPVNVDLATGNLTTGTKSHSLAALGGSLGIKLDYNSPQRSRAGLVGEYWNDAAHTGAIPTTAANVKRVDGNVDFNWGTGSPEPGVIDSNYFADRWTGYFTAPATGTYYFGGTHDDHMSVTVNGQNLYDSGGCYTGPCYGSTISLSAGDIVPIKVEHAEATGPTYAKLYVKGAVTEQIVPSDWLQTGVRSVATENGLTGRYFTYTGDTPPSSPADSDPSLFLKRNDASLTFTWPDGTSPVPGGPDNHFIARWTGNFTPDVSGNYSFKVGADDGVKMSVGSTQIINDWADHAGWRSQTTGAINMTAGTAYPISIEYYEHTGTGSFELRYIGPDGYEKAVPSKFLNSNVQTLPDGWSIGGDVKGDVAYNNAAISAGAVVLYDSSGQSHEYKWTGSGYTAPGNEDGSLTRNDNGTLTLQASDGRTYTFDLDGTLASATLAADDRNPAALKYDYGLTPSRLTKIKDGANLARYAELVYAGDSRCPSAPSGFVGANGTLLCAVVTTDGSVTTPTDANTTKFFYTTDSGGNRRLARVVSPGGETSDFGYLTQDTSSPNSCPGCLSQVRDATANDAIAAAVRTQDAAATTQIAYDTLGRVQSVMGPAPTPSANRLEHTYEYGAGTTKMHTADATEPHGFSRQITYDATFRTTEDRDASDVAIITEWDGAKEQVKSVVGGAGLKTTTLYDYADRPIDQYGPAPSGWFGGDNKPLTGTEPDSGQAYTALVPHLQTGYDQSISSLAASYYTYGTSSKTLTDAPKSHQTGIGGTGGDINKTWGGTAPFTTTSPWGVRLTGDVLLGATGDYTFRIGSDDGARLWVDDKLVIADWTDGAFRSHGQLAGVTVTNATANTYHRIRLDYYNKSVSDTDAQVVLYMTPPGGSELTGLGSLLVPRYGLPTSSKTYDSDTAVGDTTTSTNYDSTPELALPRSASLDPTGLNLTGTTTYETQGATGSYLRQTAKYLPGANPATASTGTQYSYYSLTETKDNPCTTGTTEAYVQAGMIKLKTEPDPDGGGVKTSRAVESIYDNTGRVVAARFNADSWTCTQYDARGRVTQIAVPSLGSQPARTVTTNWAVGGNPLVVSLADSAGTITTTTDLLGRTTEYTDTLGNTTTNIYDDLGRLTGRDSRLGYEEFVYDDYNRLVEQKLNDNTQATVTYDAYSRITNIAYNTAQALAQDITRDALGRTVATDYTLGDGVNHWTDAVTRSQSGQIVSGWELSEEKSYTYDKAGRLVGATIGGHTYSYGFGAPTGCTGTYNANAGKNSNRTTQTIDGVTTNFCYDYADRLVSSTDPTVTNPLYDSHGNTTSLGSSPVTTLGYDSSDRNTSITEGSKSTTFTRDAQNRITKRVVGLNSSAASTPLPSPWTTTTVSPDEASGAASYSGSTFTVSGNGYDMWDGDDQPQVATQTLIGDGTIVARVKSQTNTSEWAKAGLTIRDDLNYSSSYASVMVTPSHGVRMQYNYGTDIDGGSYTFPNAWLKLTRTGTNIKGYRSSNGTSWTQISSQTIPISTSAQIGLFVTANSPTSTTSTATFDNVSITKTNSLPSGWTNGDIGDTGIDGSASYANSTFTLKGAGTDVWDGDDEMHYAYKTLTGDGQIVTRVKSQTNTHEWAKAGIVMKSSPRSTSPYVNLHTTPDYGVRFQTNYDTDVEAGSYTFPNAWLKLVRTGNTVIGYISANGTTWTQVSSTETNLPSTITVGLFVASVNYGVLSTATFDNVAVTAGGASSSEYRYGFTGSSDAPAFLLSPTGDVVEKYLNLPGGVTKTYRGESQRIFSLPNLHGDIFGTLDENGNQIDIYRYDPFGNKISDALPNNTTGGSTFGWAGQHQKDTETNFTLAPTQMGARVYLSKIGRFLSVDPVDGGTPSAYAYPPDPVNSYDLDGKFSVKEPLMRIGGFLNKYGDGISFGLSVVSTAACWTGMGAICAVSMGLNAGIAGLRAYANSDGSIREAIYAAGASVAVDLASMGAGFIATKSLLILIPTVAKAAKALNPALKPGAPTMKPAVAAGRLGNVYGAAASERLGGLVPCQVSCVTSAAATTSVIRNMDSIIGGHYGLF